jgi:hypothetical protein
VRAVILASLLIPVLAADVLVAVLSLFVEWYEYLLDNQEA